MIARFTEQELRTFRLVSRTRLSCGSLAKELKVSRATAAKVIRKLRKKRLNISSRRDTAGWFYELIAKPDPDLAELIGSGGAGEKHYSATVDQELVEHIGEETKKPEAILR